MAFEAARAREHYEKAMQALPAADRKPQRPGLIMAAIYRALLEEIERDGFRVLTQRTSLTPLRKFWIAWKTWITRVAIVGGGYAGMAAGVALAERGVPVTVFESGPVPGGRARRVMSQGQELDNGQHIFVGAYTELLRLMRVVGVPSDALLRYPLEVRYAGDFSLRSRWLPAPLGLAAGLLCAKGVSLAERLGALRFMAALRRMRFRVEPDRHGQAIPRRSWPAWPHAPLSVGAAMRFGAQHAARPGLDQCLPRGAARHARRRR